MESIKVRQHIGQDGILHLEIPVGLREQDVEVMVIYQSVPSLTTIEPLESLYGICADDPIILDDEGISEALDDDLTGAFD
ncbi:hypothetical protein [Geitlerinema calcuttense]|uniref:AbrB family transcriptional regulator n=1 Tax=Geitlerinema calcuttense NRMC-F 0142 TaxID=2922238 RepID=A0ABT7LZM8_9CYAN|nr:hypothetical protein [Geitlerinema calcuttense]MDL5056251.1 hypothetical protein [Geitlerinema calcuttense NRMC-F 0142]